MRFIIFITILFLGIFGLAQSSEAATYYVSPSDPLWSWPMEDRIKAEAGISVTYESGGGLWKTLDGVYSDTTPPAAPTGLNVL
ncbi:hypothetical protein KKD04_01405 [Patescibacteria group bacterium]|nr:hypothetical protein [Patescibacteria group bacterium]